MDFFIGSAICQVDEQGSLTLPRAFVDTAWSRSLDGQLLVGLYAESRCLIVSDWSLAARGDVALEARRTACAGENTEQHSARLRQWFGGLAAAALDQSGTMTLPCLIRARSRIGRRALIVATGEQFEIWDLDHVLERGPSDLVTLATLHLDLPLASKEIDDNTLPDARPRACSHDSVQPGLRVRPLPSLWPRHDPIDRPPRLT